jgi:hypothetical protein
MRKPKAALLSQAAAMDGLVADGRWARGEL